MKLKCYYCSDDLSFASEYYVVTIQKAKYCRREKIGFCCSKCRDEGYPIDMRFYKTIKEGKK